MMIRVSETEMFRDWQKNNKYYLKKFAIFGDSISTFQGCNPAGYSVHYEGHTCIRTGVLEKEDTWWDQVVRFVGGRLLSNNSWSGSRVTRLPEQDKEFPSGCSDERTSALHVKMHTPDVILIYLGVNDWARGVPIQREFGDKRPMTEYFSMAYPTMLQKLRNNYPNAEIWCFTIGKTCISTQPRFVFPYTFGGVHVEKYNEMIKTIADKFDCKVVDLYEHEYDTVDGVHPSNAGMKTIAEAVLAAFYGERTPWDIWNADQESEYIFLDPKDAPAEYPEIMTVFIENTGETKQFKEERVQVGRSPFCDLVFTNSYVARQQATFLYEHGMWFLMDNDSTNGTWINGKPLQPFIKYQLPDEAEISFAKSEKVIFRI